MCPFFYCAFVLSTCFSYVMDGVSFKAIGQSTLLSKMLPNFVEANKLWFFVVVIFVIVVVVRNAKTLRGKKSLQRTEGKSAESWILEREKKKEGREREQNDESNAKSVNIFHWKKMRKVQRKAKVCTVHQMAVDSSEFERCSFSLKFSIQDRFRTFTRILLKTCVRSLYGCEPLLLYVTDTLKVIDTSVLWYCFTFFSLLLNFSFRFVSVRLDHAICMSIDFVGIVQRNRLVCVMEISINACISKQHFRNCRQFNLQFDRLRNATLLGQSISCVEFIYSFSSHRHKLSFAYAYLHNMATMCRDCVYLLPFRFVCYFISVFYFCWHTYIRLAL